MKTFAVLAVILLVALITVNEARLFGGRRPGNRPGNRPGKRPGDREEDPDRPACMGRCPRPTRRSRVCVLDEVRNRTRTFPSACLVERLGCLKGQNFTILAERPCPRPAPQVFSGQGEDSEEESEEENEDMSNESSEEEEHATTPFVPPTSPPSERPKGAGTSAMTTSASGAATVTGNGLPSESPSRPPPPPGTTTGTGSPNPSGSSPTAGVTGPDTPCVTDCPNVSSPVCGTDGQTYASACVLEAYACVNGLDTLTVAYAGVCTP